MQETGQERDSTGAVLSAQKLDDLCVWSSLGAYALAWVAVLFLLVPEPWFFAPAAAVAYVGMHFYAIKFRGFCYMFADPYAGPAVTVALAGMYFGLPVLGMDRPPFHIVLIGGFAAFFAGHVTAFLYTRILKLTLGRFVAGSTEAASTRG